MNTNETNETNEITDIRLQNDFKTISFSGYAKSKVRAELIKSIHNCDIEPAFYWSIELICAGHLNDLWNVIIYYSSRYIHITNPKLHVYLSYRFTKFKTIANNGSITNDLEFRNNKEVRKLFAELISILCFSKKNHAFEDYTIKSNEEFDITNITNKLKAPNIKFATPIFQSSDPKEIFIAINEFMYNLSNEIKDAITACYWVEWILKFDFISKQKKHTCECERRSFAMVDEKYQKNIVWVLWDCIIHVAQDKKYNKIITSLFSLFCIKYKPSLNKMRKYVLYSAISFITETIVFENPLLNNNITTEIVKDLTDKIDLIYKQVKRNEHSPKMDYLFHKLSQ
jgi:hypothetical protein